MKYDIFLLTADALKSGKTAKIAPEFEALKNAVENNAWHNEDVLKHTLSVVLELEKIFATLPGKVKKALNEKTGIRKRIDSLKIAAFFHDIAKPETLTKTIPTGCPDHEKKGANKAKEALKRFNLSVKELSVISAIIKHHGLIHSLLSSGKKNFKKEHKNFKRKFSAIYPELILLGYADTRGSYLRKTFPEDFKHRIDFYKKEIKKLGKGVNL